MKIRIEIEQDWKSFWTWFETWALALPAAVSAAYMALPDDWKAAIPAKWMHTVAIVMLLLGVVGQLVKVKANGAPPPTTPPAPK